MGLLKTSSTSSFISQVCPIHNGSPNYDYIIWDLSVVRSQEELMALLLPPVMDRCSTCKELFSMDEIDTHQGPYSSLDLKSVVSN